MSCEGFWVIDVGNTLIKFGRADGDTVTQVRALDYREHSAAALEELEQRLRSLPGYIVGCSVGPTNINTAITLLASRCGLEMHWVGVTRTALGVTCGYVETERLGVDRWVASLAAYRGGDDAVVVADIGTATTIDAVLPGGRHIGGMILPGVTLMERALHAELARLSAGAEQLVDPVTPLSFFADDTDLAVQNGCLLALSGAIREAHAAVKAEHEHARLVVSGGGAPVVIRYLPEADHQPALILEGLARLHCDGVW